MKHILFFLLAILSLSITSCKKEEVPVIKTYNVECVATHYDDFQSVFDFGLYSFEIYDENNNRIWDKSGTLSDTTIHYYSTAKSGQKITSFCLITNSSTLDAVCTTTVNLDGISIIQLSSSDSSSISVYDLRIINGKEYVVKEIKLP